MIKCYDMASCQPIGDEQTARKPVDDPRHAPEPVMRLLSVEEALSTHTEDREFPGPVVMATWEKIAGG